MRIAYVAPRYPPYAGGLETHVSRLASRLAARGHRVEVLTQTSDRSLPASETRAGVIVRRFRVPGPTGDYLFSPSLFRYLRSVETPFDLVHAHSYHALPALAAALARCGPLVFTPHYHGGGQSTLRWLHYPYRPVGNWIFRRADRVICVSRAEANRVMAQVPEVASRIEVIPNGVDVEEISSAQPFPGERDVVLAGGRLKAYKGVDRVLEAVKHLPERFRLRITGEGPQLAELEEMASAPGVADRVHFLGRIDDRELWRWYRTAKVFVSMSAEEAFGIAPLEALAGGASAVISDIPAHREVAEMVSSPALTLVPPHLPPAELARVIEDAAGRRPAPSPVLPTWDQVVEATLDVYRQVLQKGALPSPP